MTKRADCAYYIYFEIIFKITIANKI